MFTTALGNTSEATLETAILDNLTGLSEGDSFYFLAGDGTNAVLTSVDVGAGGSIAFSDSGEPHATFEGIGDLSGFTSANILGFEAAGAVTV